MKPGKWLLLLAVIAWGSVAATAQTTNPAKWRYNLKRSVDSQYQLIFHLELNKGWHVRAHNEGDTLFLAPDFSFTPNDELQLKGEMKTKGIMEKVKVDSVGTFDVYSYKVLYVQDLAAKKGTKVTGKYTYQVCNDKKCLPVKTEKFAFIMK